MISTLILIGSIIMVGNIIAYVRFIKNSTDVMLSGRRGEPIWEKTGLALLVFFLLGYLGVAFFGRPDLLMVGTQLDPDIVRIFTSIPKEELQACTPETVDF